MTDRLAAARTGVSFLLTLLWVAVLVMAVVVVATFVLRIAAMVVLLGVAPLAMLCHALPQTEPVAQLWWRSFLACLGIQLAQAAVFLAAVRVFLTPTGPTILGLPATPSGVVGVLVCAATLWLLIKIPGWAKHLILGPLARQPQPQSARLARTAVGAIVTVKTLGAVTGLTAAAPHRPVPPPHGPPGAAGGRGAAAALGPAGGAYPPPTADPAAVRAGARAGAVLPRPAHPDTACRTGRRHRLARLQQPHTARSRAPPGDRGARHAAVQPPHAWPAAAAAPDRAGRAAAVQRRHTGHPADRPDPARTAGGVLHGATAAHRAAAATGTGHPDLLPPAGRARPHQPHPGRTAAADRRRTGQPRHRHTSTETTMTRTEEPPLRARVPADVDRPDPVLFGLTARQTVVVAVTGLLLYAGWAATRTLIPATVFLLAAAPIAAAGFLTAVGHRDGIPLDRWLHAAIRHRRSPHRLVPTDGPVTAAAGLDRHPRRPRCRCPRRCACPPAASPPTGWSTSARTAPPPCCPRPPSRSGCAPPANSTPSSPGSANGSTPSTRPPRSWSRPAVSPSACSPTGSTNARPPWPIRCWRTTARRHAAFLDDLAAHRELLHRQITIAIRDRRSPAAALHRAGDAARALAACEVAATVLDADHTAATLDGCFRPDPAGDPA